MEPLYVSAVTSEVAAVWQHTSSGRLTLVRTPDGQPLVAPDVDAAQALAPGPSAVVDLSDAERTLLRSAVRQALPTPARVHVSPVPGARAPQAFAWYGPDDPATPQVLRHQGRLAVWNGATPEDACAGPWRIFSRAIPMRSSPPAPKRPAASPGWWLAPPTGPPTMGSRWGAALAVAAGLAAVVLLSLRSLAPSPGVTAPGLLGLLVILVAGAGVSLARLPLITEGRPSSFYFLIPVVGAAWLLWGDPTGVWVTLGLAAAQLGRRLVTARRRPVDGPAFLQSVTDVFGVSAVFVGELLLTGPVVYFVKPFSPFSSRKIPHRSGGEFSAGQEPTALPFFHECMRHPVACAVEEEQVAMMRETVNHRRRHLIIGEETAPLRAREVRGQDEAPSLVAVGHDAEQPRRAVSVPGDIPPLIQHEQVRPL